MVESLELSLKKMNKKGSKSLTGKLEHHLTLTLCSFQNLFFSSDNPLSIPVAPALPPSLESQPIATLSSSQVYRKNGSYKNNDNKMLIVNDKKNKNYDGHL